MQLESFKQFVSQNRHLVDSIERNQPEKVKLVLIGGSRNEEDQARIKNLQRKAVEFKLEDRLEFKVNISRDELIKYLSKATIGVHTMFNEHFGIGVVEFMVCEILFDYYYYYFFFDDIEFFFNFDFEQIFFLATLVRCNQ